MSEKLIAPDLRRTLDDYARRLSILERQITNAGRAATTASGHDGTGDDSTAVSGASVTNPAQAAGFGATSVGGDTSAEQNQSVALGYAAFVEPAGSGLDRGGIAIGSNAYCQSSAGGVAIGESAQVNAQSGVAIGLTANASHDGSVALGSGALTTGYDQIQLGDSDDWTVIGLPTTAIASGELAARQASFYIDEAGNTLKVKVKYSDGTIKTGTVALV